MRKTLLRPALLLAAFPAMPVAAAPKPLDARCLAVSMLATRSQDAKTKQAAVIAVAYWMGRLDGSGTPAEVEAELIRQAPEISAATLQSEADRCSPVHVQRLRALEAIGPKMQAGRATK